jgi:hypothetical protein
MDTVFSAGSIVVAAKDHVSCPLGDDIIILDLRAGLYFSLDNVGAMVWQLIQQPRTMQDLRAAILEAFDVSADLCERDLVALLQQLAAKDLIEIRNAAAV